LKILDTLTPGPPSMPSPASTCCRPTPDPLLDDADVEAVTAALELLAHPIRLRLLAALVQGGGPACVCDLEALVPVKQPTVSHHLKLLRAAGLVRATREGSWMYYAAQPSALGALRRQILLGLDAVAPAEPHAAESPPLASTESLA
jgi:ArsR family transcriptional regulator, arsenate/arsenite/antimonite-responsive transcriptional repressor